MPTKTNRWKNENVDEIAKNAGEISQFRYIVPNLNFNGNKGEFTLMVPDDKKGYKAKDLGQEIKFIILKVRQKWLGFKKVNKVLVATFSSEFDKFSDKIVILEKSKETGKTKKIADSLADKESIKTIDPDMKYTQVLYVLYEGEIVKITIKGGNLSPFWEYSQAVKELDKRHFQFVTKLERHEEEGQQGTYYQLDFLQDSESDPAEVKPKLDELKKNLEKQDKSYAERSTSAQDEAEKEKLEQEKIKDSEDSGGILDVEVNPEADTEAKEDEVNVEDIPF